MSSEDLPSIGFSSVLENLNKKTGSNYCALCDVKTSSRNNFLSHILGRRHQSQLKKIETAGFENWAKTEAKKAKENARTVDQLKKSAKKDRNSRDSHRQSPVLEKTIPEKERPKRSQGAKSKEEKALNAGVIDQGEGNDKNNSSLSLSTETFHSKISCDSKNCSSVEKNSVVSASHNQTENLSVSSQFSSSPEMEPHSNFRFPQKRGLLPLPQFNSRHSSSNYHSPMSDSRSYYWQKFPPQTNYRGRFQYQYGRASRTFSSAGSPPFRQQSQRAKDTFDSEKSNDNKRGGSQNAVSDQPLTLAESRATHTRERSKDSVISKSSPNRKPYQKSNDDHSRHEDFSNNTDSYLQEPFDMHQYPFTQGGQTGTAYPKNSKDRRTVQSEREQRYKTYSPPGREKRHSAEKQKDTSSENLRSRRSGSRRSLDDNHGDDFHNGSEVRSSKGIRNEKVQSRQTEKSTECAQMSQNKKNMNPQVPSKTSEKVSRKSTSDGKLIDCSKTKSLSSTSDSSSKSPPFSNIAMQRMNARLQSLTKYGKMPTSGQIRHLALSAPPAQERREGKLQEWSKRIESHHNLSAQDKELINRLVNYPSSRREQKKLEYCLREHARSRKKLTLPRFNLQLSGMEDCKEPSGVDDNVNSMVTEVVDCLPEDVLNSLINALNSDIDEYVTVSLPPSMDTCMSLPSDAGDGMCTSPNLSGSKKHLDEDVGSKKCLDEDVGSKKHLDEDVGSKKCLDEDVGSKKRLDEDVFITVDEVGGNSSCDEAADCHQQRGTSSAEGHAASHHSSGRLEMPLPREQSDQSTNVVTDYTSPVKAAESSSHGSSLEVCKSLKIPSKDSLKSSECGQTIPVDVDIKEESFKAQDRNREKCLDLSKPNFCSEKVGVSSKQSSSNSMNIIPDLGSASVQIKKENSYSCTAEPDIIEISPVVSHYPSRLSSLSHVSSTEKFVDRYASVKQELREVPCTTVGSEMITVGEREGTLGSRTAITTTAAFKRGMDGTLKMTSSENNVRPFPGLSYLIKPVHEPVVQTTEMRKGAAQANKYLNSGNIFTTLSLDCNTVQNGSSTLYTLGNQLFQCSSNLSAAAPVIKGEQSNGISSRDVQTGEYPLPVISSVTTMRNAENFMGNNSASLAVYPEVQIKQEPALNENTERSETKNSKAKMKRIPPVELPVSVDGSSSTVESHGHRVSSLCHKEDTDKISEVSSSTGALLDEVQAVFRSSPDSMHHTVFSRNDGTSPDLIRELLSITSSEEKLVQQASEAERTIAQLTASLEEWKRKKYEIEHKQMKLRMKRQELLLLNAAKGSIPCDKYGNTSLHSLASSKTFDHDHSSGDEKRSVASMQSASVFNCDKSAPESDSSSSPSLNGTHRHSASSYRKKRKKITQNTTYGNATNLRNKSHPNGGEFNSSSVNLTNKQGNKRRSRSRSFPVDDQCSSPERNTPKKRCCDTPLQPLHSSSTGDNGKIVANSNNDDIIVLEDSPTRSLESTEEAEDSSSEDGSVIIQEETESVSSQEDVIAATPDTVVNIRTLTAHDAAIIDLKVYDGYLYSCSLDCTAKRFSLADPANDNTSYEGHEKTVTSICLSPNKEVYTTCNDTYIRCFVAKSGVKLESFEMKSSISCSCAGTGMLYLGLSTGEVIFFSFRTKKIAYELKSASCSISRLATATQGAQHLLCVVANDGIVSLYDTSTGILLRCLETHVRPPCCIQVCNDSVYISTSEKSIVIHSLLSGKLVRMVNWAASATGLEIINNYILTSSYDGLIRCHDINQDMVSHSIYYGAGNAMVMSMTAYKEWVFTGNRKGVLEAFKFDPSKKLACQYGRCRLKYGRECDVHHHVTIDHLPCVNMKTKKCPWTGCSREFTPRTAVEEKKTHVKGHVICTY